jgi:hypothetical protein
MIPRVLIYHPTTKVLQLLGSLGYTSAEDVHGAPYISLQGSTLNPYPVPVPGDKTSVLDGADLETVRETAVALLLTGTGGNSTTIKVGTAHLDVQVTVSGVVIDGCFLPITALRRTVEQVKTMVKPTLGNYGFHISATAPFMTIGCADYSLADYQAILVAQEELTKPTS